MIDSPRRRRVAGPALRSESGAALPRGFWVLTALCAILPDADVVAFDLGLDYGHMLGHRGISHSLPFAVGVGAAVAAALGRGTWRTARVSLFVYFFLVTASHGFLDAFTDEGLGVAFFAPFSGERYFFPWRPLEVAPIGGHGFFTAREVRGGLRWVEVLWSEVRWVWIPAAAVVLAAWQRRRIGRAPG
jgi:inner membrane protein